MSDIIDDPSLNWNAWSISLPLARQLLCHLEETKPRRILEAGSGISTVVLAHYAARFGARLVTLEHNPLYYAETRRLLEHFGTIEAIVKASTEELARVRGIGAATAEAIRWTVRDSGAEYGTEPFATVHE